MSLDPSLRAAAITIVGAVIAALLVVGSGTAGAATITGGDKGGADVVPTAVLGSRAVMRKHSLLIHPGTITVRFGEPIEVVGMTLRGRDQLLHDSREAVVRLLAAPAEPSSRDADHT